MIIGIDVGGTNTDGVLMHKQQIYATAKVPTTADVTYGIVNAIEQLLAQQPSHMLKRVVIGTTHFTNAVIERKHLEPCAIIRLCLPSSTSIPPLTGFPDDLLGCLGNHVYMLHGAYEVNGEVLSDLNPDEVVNAARDIQAKGITSIVLSGVFSPINATMEQEAARIIQGIMPQATLTLSHTIGRIGLLERENAAVLNATLRPLAQRTVAAFRRALYELNLDVPLYISQNDGTIASADFVEQYPALTFASGPTNSIRGAGLLSGLRDAIVIDIGGTTTDIGVLVNGLPRQAQHDVMLGGVRTNFRMPDTLSFALGGGTIVHEQPFAVDIASVGHALTEQSRVFGGDTLTLTDIAVAAEWLEVGDPSLLVVSQDTLVQAETYIQGKISEIVDQMKPTRAAIPAIVVGGGSVLLQQTPEGISELLRPEYFHVANAVGAATAQIGGEVDKIYVLTAMNRADALQDAQNEAIARAIQSGADPNTIEIASIEEVPLAYLGDETIRIVVKVIGDLST